MLLYTLVAVRDLKDRDLKIFVEEVVARLRDGEGRQQIANDLNWSMADFGELLQHPTFQKHFEKVDAAGYEAFRQVEFDTVVGSARQFARDRMPSYIEQLDWLARHSTNENVKYNALMSLLRLAGAQENEAPEEVVQMPKTHAEIIKRAFKAVATEDRKAPLKF